MTLQLVDGSVRDGHWIARTPAAVLLAGDQGTDTIDTKKILKIDLDVPIDVPRIGAYAGLLAGYAVMAIGADGPGFFQPRDGIGAFLSPAAMLGGAAVGGTVALVVGAAASQREFLFAGDTTARNREWRWLDEALAQVPNRKEYTPPRFHLTVSSAFVFMPNGMNWSFVEGGWGSVNSSSAFTFIRSVHLAYSVVPQVDAGIRYNALTEPERNSPDAKGTVSARHYELSGYAVLATVEAHPLRGVVSRSLDFHLGGGLGFGKCSYEARDIEYGTSGSTSGAEISRTDHAVDESGMALSCFVGFDVLLFEGLSLGLTADFTAVPGVTLEGMPSWGLAERTAGNFALGLEVRAHF